MRHAVRGYIQLVLHQWWKPVWCNRRVRPLSIDWIPLACNKSSRRRQWRTERQHGHRPESSWLSRPVPLRVRQFRVRRQTQALISDDLGSSAVLELVNRRPKWLEDSEASLYGVKKHLRNHVPSRCRTKPWKRPWGSRRWVRESGGLVWSQLRLRKGLWRPLPSSYLALKKLGEDHWTAINQSGQGDTIIKNRRE